MPKEHNKKYWGKMAPLEPSSPVMTNPRYLMELKLKKRLLNPVLKEAFKDDINKTLKETQENTFK